MFDISKLKPCSGAELPVGKEHKSYVFFRCTHHNFTGGIQTARGNEK